MAENIGIDKNQFASTRGELLSSVVNFQNILKNISTANAALSESWEGDAGEVFKLSGNSIEKELFQLAESLKGLIKDIDIVENGFTDLDNELAALTN